MQGCQPLQGALIESRLEIDNCGVNFLYLITTCRFINLNHESDGGAFSISAPNSTFLLRDSMFYNVTAGTAKHGGGFFVNQTSNFTSKYNCYMQCGAGFGSGYSVIAQTTGNSQSDQESMFLTPFSNIYDYHSLRIQNGVISVSRNNISSSKVNIGAFFRFGEFSSSNLVMSSYTNSSMTTLFEIRSSDSQAVMDMCNILDCSQSKPDSPIFSLAIAALLIKNSAFHNVAFTNVTHGSIQDLIIEHLSICNTLAVFPDQSSCGMPVPLKYNHAFACESDRYFSQVFTRAQLPSIRMLHLFTMHYTLNL